MSLSFEKVDCARFLYQCESSYFGHSSWHQAVECGKKGLLELLYTNPETKKRLSSISKIQTPLELAISKDQKDSIAILCGYEKQENELDSWLKAVKHGDKAKLQQLYENPKTKKGIKAINEMGQTPLLYSLSIGQEECINTLREYERGIHSLSLIHI